MEQHEFHRELLQLPDYVFPAAMLVFGYPTQQQLDRPKPQRCPQAQVVHENRYRHMEGEELRTLLGNKPGHQDYETWCQAFCKRKYNSDFSREMTRSVGEYLKQYGWSIS
jgi:hypothetical protein